MELKLLPGVFAVCRLGGKESLPEWANGAAGPFVSATWTGEELSIVCAQEVVPEGVTYQGNWAALRVAGTLDFALVGVLAQLTACLAAAGISVFAVSTYDTDYLLFPGDRRQQVLDALRAAGHRIVSS